MQALFRTEGPRLESSRDLPMCFLDDPRHRRIVPVHMAVVVQTDTRLEFFHTLAGRDTFGHSSVQCFQEAAQRETG